MKAGYTHIGIVLDRSGSMAAIKSDTIGGFNTFLAAQKVVPGPATLSLAQFDDVYELVHDMKPINDIPPLDNATFVPRASTALLDAIARSIDATGKRLGEMLDADRPEKVIFVIITDGDENASREFTRQQVFDRITHQREKYGWEFVFIGANQDAIAAGGSMGFSAGTSLSTAANAVGTRSTYASLSANAGNYRTGKTSNMNWTDDDRKKQAAAGAKS